MQKTKSNHWSRLKKYSPAIKLILGLVICYFLFENLTDSPEKKQRLSSLLNPDFLSLTQKWIFASVILLMPINWMLETLKWQFASKKISKLKFSNALKGILSGVSVSFLFPNRTGDFTGRLLFFPIEKRMKGLIASLMASFSQLVVLLVFGGITVLFFIPIEILNLEINASYLTFLISLILIFNLLLYFYSHKIGKLRFKHKKLNRALKFIKVFGLFDHKTKSKLLLFSLLRYLVFCSQFAILLAFFTNSFSLKFLLFAPASFFATTVIPSLTFAELGIREWVNYTLSNMMGIDEQAAVLSGLALWFINVLPPSFIGIFFIFKAKLFKD